MFAQGCAVAVAAGSGKIHGMRAFLLLLLMPLAGGGCSPGHAAARKGDGMLSLEVGGGHASLRGSLEAAGVAVGPAQRLREPDPEPAAAAAPEPAGERPPVAVDDLVPPSPSADDDAAPPPAPRPSPDYFVVTLGPRQNLIQLAKKHLGNGNRFREIMELNGWSEADTRRLQPGRKVKIPRTADAASKRR